jgi:predicted nucleic acid-binding protein
MTILYFDTSAIVKRYRKEIDSEVLDKIFELKVHAFTIFFCRILEFIVAISRAYYAIKAHNSFIILASNISTGLSWLDLGNLLNVQYLIS